MKDQIGFRSKFDIVLAAAFEKAETDGSFFPMYEQIAAGIGTELEKSVFLPHIKIPESIKSAEVYRKLHGAIMNASLVLVNAEEESTAAGMMMGIVNQVCVHQIYFHEQGKRAASLGGRPLGTVVEYTTREEGIGKIVDVVGEFYSTRE